MTTDLHGHELSTGDVVTVRCKVVRADHHHDEQSLVLLETLTPMIGAAKGYRPQIVVNGSQIEKL